MSRHSRSSSTSSACRPRSRRTRTSGSGRATRNSTGACARALCHWRAAAGFVQENGHWREAGCGEAWEAPYDELLYRASGVVIATVEA